MQIERRLMHGLRLEYKVVAFFALAACGFSQTASAQVTINAGSGAGAFQCTEGAAPTLSGGTDSLWCDSSHWFVMNNDNSNTFGSTSVMGVISSEVDNTISISEVDGSGNPSYLGVSGGTVTLNAAGATPFVAYIAGLRVQVISSISSGANLTTVSTVNYIYLNQAAQPAGSNLGSTTFAPVYSYTAPASCPSGSVPQFWFDLSTNLMKSCSSSGSYVATKAIFLGVIATNGSNNSLGIAHEPWRLNPYRRYELFGNGSVAATTITSNTVVDGWQQYIALEVTGGTLSHTAVSGSSANGLFIWSQNPILVANSGKISAVGLGFAGATGTTTTGSAGTAGAFGGSGGGGGGALSTNAGSAGGTRMLLGSSTGTGAGGAGGAANTVGNAGAGPTNLPPFFAPELFYCAGAGGGAGGGDGTHNGAAGGAGGGCLMIRAPALVIQSGTQVACDGGAGGNGTSNTGGGGGGGGGTCIIYGGYITQGVTITSAGGAGGSSLNAKGGGVGGAGIVQVVKAY
jgi:hypothetical protein